MRQAPSPPIQAGGDIAVNIGSFARHLRAENLSPRTVETYTESARQLATFLAEKGMPQDVAHITREHVEAVVTLSQAKGLTASASS